MKSMKNTLSTVSKMIAISDRKATIKIFFQNLIKIAIAIAIFAIGVMPCVYSTEQKVAWFFIWNVPYSTRLDDYLYVLLTYTLKTYLKKIAPYARDKTAVDLFHFSLFCLWSIRESVLFKKAVYLINLKFLRYFVLINY